MDRDTSATVPSYGPTGHATRYPAGMKLLNDKPVLLSGNCLFRGGDRVAIGGPVALTFSVSEAAQPTIAVSASGGGFAVDIAGFTPGRSMTSEAKGNLGDGRLIVILTLADRVAELSSGPVYKVEYLVAERDA